MFQPVGGMDRIAHALYEQVRPAVRLRQPGHRDPPPRRRRADPARAGRAGVRRRLLHLHAAAEPAAAHPERLLAGQAGGDQRRRLSAERQGRLRSRRASGRRRGFTAGSAGPTGRTRICSIRRAAGMSDKGVLVAAYCAGWTGQDHPAEFTAMSHEDRFRICREVVERLHPGQVATARQAGHRRLGPDALVGRRRAGRARLGRQTPRAGALCRAAAPGRPDLLRRRASELRPLLAGRRRALGARGDAAAHRPGGGARGGLNAPVEAAMPPVETAWATCGGWYSFGTPPQGELHMLKRALIAFALALAAAARRRPGGAGRRRRRRWRRRGGRPTRSRSTRCGKPAEVLRLLGLKRGDRVLDYFTGTGYYAEIMARAVGPHGPRRRLEHADLRGQRPVRAALDGIRQRSPNVGLLRDARRPRCPSRRRASISC